MTTTADATAAPTRRLVALTPLAAALVYPWLLSLFHGLVSSGQSVAAAVVLALAVAMPAAGFAFALGDATAVQSVHALRMRRLAYLAVVTPTAFVFLGVVQALVGSKAPDPLVWTLLWAAVGLWAWSGSPQRAAAPTPIPKRRWRVIHGIAAAVLVLYVGFHIGNHLFSLLGPEAHGRVMDLGRKVYRAKLVEPVLVALFLFQGVTGLWLAWRWSAHPGGFHRTLQVASGLYLFVFIIGHMNSVFVYARTYLGIKTDWAFATGAPTGLIHDAWNIRLVPHYGLGVFLVLTHLALGLRQVALAHGAPRRAVDIAWAGATLVAAVVAAAILCGMCGVRLG